MKQTDKSLSRELGLAECVTIGAGAVIGVGLFTVGSSQVGIAGGSIIVATLIAMLLVIWPALIYGELGATLPLSGGTYAYAKRSLGWPIAIFTSWHYTLAQIGIAAGEALAFANYFNQLLWALGVPDSVCIDTRISACALLLFFTLINYRGIEFSGRLQNAFMFFFWGASTLWVVLELKHLDLSHFVSVFGGLPLEFVAFAKMVVMVWWCFAGFETIVGMGSEVRFPQINIPRAMTIVPLLVFAVNALWQFFLVGLTPLADLSVLAASEAPFVDGMKAAGVVGFPVILLCLVITLGGDFSTMIPCTGGAARYMYTAALDGCLPAVFSRVHPRFRSPFVAVIGTGVIAGLVILTDSILIVSSMCAFSQVFCYIVGFVSYIVLRVREPDLRRPYRAPAGMTGAAVSIVAYLALMLFAVDRVAIWYNVGWSVLSIAYIVFGVILPRRRPPAESVDVELLALKTREPTKGERIELDAQYRLWLGLSILAAAIGIGLFAVGFMASGK